MKSKAVKSFMTTREVSNLLGLSTGTVQKMVDKKILESYLTTGGHRRIATASFERYLAKVEPQLSNVLRGRMHLGQSGCSGGEKKLTFLVNKVPSISTSDKLYSNHLTFIAEPSDLFKLFCHRGVLVIDAAVTWVDWFSGLQKLFNDEDDFSTVVLIFNSHLISEDKFKDIPRTAVLFKEDLAVDFVRGYFALQSRFAGGIESTSIN